MNKLGAILLGIGAVVLGLWVAGAALEQYVAMRDQCMAVAADTGSLLALPGGCRPWSAIWSGGFIFFGGLGAAGRMWNRR